MQIEVPLTLTIEVPDKEAAAEYLETDAAGELTATVNTDYIADLFDDDVPDMIIYGNNSHVVKVCGKTPEEIKHILSSRIPR